MGMGWEWKYGHGNGREWDQNIHSSTSLLAVMANLSYKACYELLANALTYR